MKTGHTIKCLISGDSFFDYPVNNTLVYLVTSLSKCHSTFSFYVLSLFSYLDTLHFFTFLLYFLSQHSHSTFFSWISLSPFSLDFVLIFLPSITTLPLKVSILPYLFTFLLISHSTFFISFSLYFASLHSEPTFFSTLLLHFSSNFSLYFISLLSSLYFAFLHWFHFLYFLFVLS